MPQDLTRFDEMDSRNETKADADKNVPISASVD
jgi:hypothetical protein